MTDDLTFTTNAAQLTAALARLLAVADRRATVPILQNVLIEAGDGGTLSLTTTNMDMRLTEQIGAAKTKGCATACAATLHAIVKAAPAGLEVVVSSAGDRLTIRCGDFEANLMTEPVADFPTWACVAPTQFTIPAPRLRKLFDWARHAISTEETRCYLNGIYLEAGAALTATATDGHRLVRISDGLPAGATGMPGSIVPRAAVNRLCSLLNGVTRDVLVSVADAETSRISFRWGSSLLATKTIDGTFPDVDRVIPKDNPYVLRLPSASLRPALEMVSGVGTERARRVGFDLRADKVTLKARTYDNDTAEMVLRDAAYTGATMVIGFQARYIREILDQADGDLVWRIKAANNDPVTIEVDGDASALFVLMPMRLS